MATAEGTFPKIGNDPIYASEYNNFAKSTLLLKTGSFATTGSAEGNTGLGSIVFPAGTFPNTGELFEIKTYANITKAGAMIGDSIGILFSGTWGNANHSLGAGANPVHIETTIIVGSPLTKGIFKSLGTTAGAIDENAYVVGASRPIENVDPTKDIVIEWNGNIKADTTIDSYMVYITKFT